MKIAVSSRQFKKNEGNCEPMSAACFKPNALNILEKDKKFMFQSIPAIRTKTFNEWSDESQKVVKIIYLSYLELFDLDLDEKGVDIIFYNWVTYLIFHYKSASEEYNYLKNKNLNLKVESPFHKLVNIPKNIKELRVMLQSDDFNESLAYYFIENKIRNFEQLENIINKTNIQNESRTLKQQLKSLIKRLHLITSKKHINIFPDNFLVRIISNNFELMPDMDDYNFTYSDFNNSLRKRLYFHLKNGFLDAGIDNHNSIALYLSCYIPKALLEDFKKIEEISDKITFKQGSNFFLKTAHYNNELLKIKLAKEVKVNNIEIIITSHGGGYHLPKWTDRDWEKRIASKIIPFSQFRQRTNLKTINRPPDLKNVKTKNYFIPEDYNNVLVVGTTFEIYRSGVLPAPDQWQMCEKYAESLSSLCYQLKNIYKKVYFRPHFNDYGWNLPEYLKSHNPHLCMIDPKEVTLEENLRNFKSIINTADTTAILKCFNSNIFHLGLIDPMIWYDNEIIEEIKLLYKNKIFFKDPIKLCQFIETTKKYKIPNDIISEKQSSIDNFLYYQC